MAQKVTSLIGYIHKMKNKHPCDRARQNNGKQARTRQNKSDKVRTRQKKATQGRTSEKQLEPGRSIFDRPE